MIDSGRTVSDVMTDLGITAVDESELESLCRQHLAANPHVLADLKSGKLKAVGALIGQAKKKYNPNVNPGRVRELCLELAAKM